jgi:type IV secretion system protein VirD4
MPAARLATQAEAETYLGDPGAEGLYLGRYLDVAAGRLGDKLVYRGERHAILFGPNGSGKGASFLMPNLLGDYLKGRSVVVIDPKGELAAVCAGCRHWMENGRRGSVKILDPFGKLREVVGNSPQHDYLAKNGLLDSEGFNPLAALDSKTDNFYDDAAAIGEALIKIEGNEPHWSESAQGLITGLVMWEAARTKAPGEVASLDNVRRILTEPDEYDKKNPENKDLMRGLRASARQIVEACGETDEHGELKIKAGYEIASLLGRFTRKSKELASIQSTADTQTRWLLSKRIRHDLNKAGGINFRAIRDTPTTVFVILPAERMRTHSVWLRLVVVSVLRAMYNAEGLRSVLLIDELAALGHLAPLEDAFGLVRGYGVQIVGVLQDLTQLKSLYKERWESFLANAGVVQGFAPNDLTTGDWMSRRSGQTTVRTRGASTGTNFGGDRISSSSGESWSETARPYYLPHDLFGMAEGSGVLWLAGLADTVRFFADKYADLPAYSERAMPNPYYRGNRPRRANGGQPHGLSVSE